MNENIYIVKENDNLYDIAKNHNTTIGILKALNKLESNILQIGQVLKLPTAPATEASPSDYIIYTVKNGDNLYQIAKTHDITLNELINFNEQGTTLLHIGDQILIPKKTSTEDISYIVKPGDTIFMRNNEY